MSRSSADCGETINSGMDEVEQEEWGIEFIKAPNALDNYKEEVCRTVFYTLKIFFTKVIVNRFILAQMLAILVSFFMSYNAIDNEGKLWKENLVGSTIFCGIRDQNSHRFRDLGLKFWQK